MAVTYGYITTPDEPVGYEFTVEDYRKMNNEINGFSEGGWVEPNKYPIVGDPSPSPYYIPNSAKTYIGANTSTVIRTLKYKATNADGTVQYIYADVLHDGTIHVDPSAFTMLMEKLGYEDDNADPDA